MDIVRIGARELHVNQKTILERVKQTKQPAVIVTNDEPQVVIMPLEAAEELARFRKQQAFSALREIAEEIARTYPDALLPTDLAENHDKYFVEEWEEARRHQEE